jgi:putative PIN family toxin of toxin-antitoxin system
MIDAQAMISRSGPAGACMDQVRSGHLHLVWSDYVLQEVREPPGKLPTRLKLTSDRVEAFIADIAPYAEHKEEVVERYENPFDADDSHYINLVVASGSNLITSRDSDLLRRMDQRLPEARDIALRFPNLQILPPQLLLELLRHAA